MVKHKLTIDQISNFYTIVISYVSYENINFWKFTVTKVMEFIPRDKFIE